MPIVNTGDNEPRLVFGPTLVPPHAEATLREQAHVVFRPIRFDVDPLCAIHFTINSLHIGKWEMIATQQPIPAVCFTGDKHFSSFEMLHASMQTYVVVTNHSDEPQEFRASFLGLIDDGGPRKTSDRWFQDFYLSKLPKT
jgi:hypothetical protein